MKLTKEKISEIQTMSMEGIPIKEISKRVNTSISTIKYHTNEKYKEDSKRRATNYQESLSKEKKKQIQISKKEYQRNYRKKRYHEDEEFRLKCIQRSKNNNGRNKDKSNVYT